MADIIQFPFTRLQYAGINNPGFISDWVAANQGVLTGLAALAGLGNTDFGIFQGFAYTAGSPGTYGPGWFFLNGKWYYQSTTFNENQSLIPNVTDILPVSFPTDSITRNTYEVNYSQVGSGAIGGVSVAAGGTGYVVGDLLTIIQSGASNGVVKVTTVSAGAVTGVSIAPTGTGKSYSAATGLGTTGGTGTGCTITITSVFQTPVFATGGNMNIYRLDNKNLFLNVLPTVCGNEQQSTLGSGYVVTFTADKVVYFAAAPSNATITFDLTNARIGVVVILNWTFSGSETLTITATGSQNLVRESGTLALAANNTNILNIVYEGLNASGNPEIHYTFNQKQ